MWLKDNGLTPENLLVSDPKALLKGWSDRQITPDRLEALLYRGSSLAIAMEKWLRAGLWILSRSDVHYPSRLKNQLGLASPALIFGCGNELLLDRGGLAVVGSRNACGDDLDYTRDLGAAAAGAGYSVVSGAARGVDEAAMLGTLESEGTAVGVLADSLLRACSSAKYRHHLSNGNLVLISTFYPEAGFNAGNAMQRNKYIYCLADAALVIHSGTKGGTWNGANENLRNRWVPLWVKKTTDAAAGNHALSQAGGRLLNAEVARAATVRELFVNSENVSLEVDTHDEDSASATDSGQTPMEEKGNAGVLPGAPGPANTRKQEHSNSAGDCSDAVPKGGGCEASASLRETYLGSPVVSSDNHWANSHVDAAFYELFVEKLSKVCANASKTPDELAASFGLHKGQVNVWLKRALVEEKLNKRVNPVRYEWNNAQQTSFAESNPTFGLPSDGQESFPESHTGE